MEGKNPACAGLKNRCNKDGFCDAESIEEQKTCAFYTPLKTQFPGDCMYLMFKGNCQNPDALTAKWEEQRAEGQRPKTEGEA